MVGGVGFFFLLYLEHNKSHSVISQTPEGDDEPQRSKIEKALIRKLVFSLGSCGITGGVWQWD